MVRKQVNFDSTQHEDVHYCRTEGANEAILSHRREQKGFLRVVGSPV